MAEDEKSWVRVEPQTYEILNRLEAGTKKFKKALDADRVQAIIDHYSKLGDNSFTTTQAILDFMRHSDIAAAEVLIYLKFLQQQATSMKEHAAICKLMLEVQRQVHGSYVKNLNINAEVQSSTALQIVRAVLGKNDNSQSERSDTMGEDLQTSR